ncbi:MAG: DHH family phosphoesterase [Mycoplasma sp.]|nr:DHH family phosphoesterase [Mycoplasma sp.]
MFDFLKFKFNKTPSDSILKKSLGIVVDANYSNRIVNNEIILENKIKDLIRIDHHPEEDDINYKLRFVDSSYCASAEQIADLIHVIDPKSLNKEIAILLYLGIYTDSGRFFYDYTSSRTHNLTSWLFETNFDFFNLHKDLSRRSIKDLEFNKYVLDNYQTYKNVIYCVLTRKQINKLKINDSSTNRVDFLANIDNYDIWIFFIENKDKTYRVRLRSSEKDISKLAREYNGGGHKKASGAIINNKSQILEVVKKASKISK